MNSEESDVYPKWLAIPEVFWSDLTKQPFNKCIQCETELLESGSTYVIEKAVKGFHQGVIHSTLFEYAMCIDCVTSLRGELSESSRKNIEEFYKRNVDFSERLKNLKGMQPEAWIEECLINKKTLDSHSECQLYGLCQGDQFIYQEFPYMISGEALDQVVDLISDETMDELDRFKNDLTSGPPELKELLEKGGPRVFI